MSLDLNAIKERREAAYEWVFAMCEGKTRFQMSIPYEETDTDAILCAALRDSENLAAEVEKLREASGEGDDLTTAYMVGLEEGKDWARDEAAELRAALRTLVTDLEDLMEESHVQLYDGNGALVDTSWGKLLQGGKDEYLSNWNEAKRLSGGEEESMTENEESMSDRQYTYEQLDGRMERIERQLRNMVSLYMRIVHPGVKYTLEVFGSDNGEEHWQAPMAARLEIPSLDVTDAYGLCDAGSGTILGQAEFLMTQIWEEAKPQIERFNK